MLSLKACAQFLLSCMEDGNTVKILSTIFNVKYLFLTTPRYYVKGKWKMPHKEMIGIIKSNTGEEEDA